MSNMNKNTIKKIYLIILATFIVVATAFYYLLGDQLRYKESVNNIIMVDADAVTDEIIEGVEIRQTFTSSIDRIETIAIVFTKFYREGKGKVYIDILDGETKIYSKQFDVQKDIPEQHRVFLDFEKPLEAKDKKLTISIKSTCKANEGLAVMMKKNVQGSYVKMNNKNVPGTLCFSVSGLDKISASQYYWYFMISLALLLGLLLYRSYVNYTHNRYDYLVRGILAIERYSFLISQLVTRDFKSKYKRSVFGLLWSFLNPLLTMIVQFLVFSTFFKANTQNYPVYLLSGVICFNFFKETTEMCLTSISGNSNLINKVYIPRYIFPLARTLSSSVNLVISLVPLLLITLIMGMKLRASVLLIIFFLLCLIAFSLGAGMLLATLMVFFRDTQFLWGVLVQIWQYATPIFYPAEIIPDKYKFVVRFNPLYHFIGNLRKCLIDGISPEPISYLYCLIFAIGMLLIGTYVFKKNQDKFTLYL